MTIQGLARRYHALENVDRRNFQLRARLLQSIWREEQGYEPTTYRGKVRGARLPMPWAKETLANYLTDTIRDVVRAEVLDPKKAAGKLYGQPRMFNNLLSSQPLCFNRRRRGLCGDRGEALRESRGGHADRTTRHDALAQAMGGFVELFLDRYLDWTRIDEVLTVLDMAPVSYSV